MTGADRTPWKYVIGWWRIAFAVHLLYSGLAYAITGWVPMDMAMAREGTGQFLIALNSTGLYMWVKYFEIIIGACLLFDIAVPLVLVLHMPVTMMIAYLNLVVQPHGRELFTGPQELALHVPLLFAYGGYYTCFLRPRARPWWLWDNFPVRSIDPDPAPAHSVSEGSRLPLAFAIVGGAMLLVLSGSYFLSPTERQLVPRDWVHIALATLTMLVAIVRDRR